MPIDYKKDRDRQEDVGFKTAAFVAGMCHYFSISFIINILIYSNNKKYLALGVVIIMNIVVFGGLFAYSYVVYHIKGIGNNIWKVLKHEIFPFLLCFIIDILGGA